MKTKINFISSNKFYPAIILLTLFLLPDFLSGIYQDDIASKLAIADNYYKSAMFDETIDELKDLAASENINAEYQKDILRFLSRAYVAKGYYDKAKKEILKLIELEPPIISLNPDREPPQLMKVYYEARKIKSNSYKVETEDPGIKTMAIIDFKNRSIDQKERFDPMEKGFSDLFIHRLNNSTGLKVIERDRIQWILDEIGIQDQHNMGGAVRMGKQLGVHSVLLGSFMIFNDEIWLGARLVKVETSEILLTDEIKGEVDEFYDLTEKLSKQIAEKVDVTIKEVTAGVDSETKSLNALLSYSEGLSFLELGNYSSAYKKFMKALEYDPNYKNAKLKAESIKPFIG